MVKVNTIETVAAIITGLWIGAKRTSTMRRIQINDAYVSVNPYGMVRCNNLAYDLNKFNLTDVAVCILEESQA